MSGILSLGVYIPRYRLSSSALSVAWGKSKPNFERPVANHDEDSLTMAHEALVSAMEGRDPRDLDGLFFATTTPPYREKSAAGLLATVLDARREIYASDFQGSLRSFVAALRAAHDALGNNSARFVAIGAADLRPTAPGSADETILADAAGALLLGSENTALVIEGVHSVNEDFYDVWRTESDPYIRRGDAKFVQEEGYEALGIEAMGGVLQSAGLDKADVDRVLLCVPDSRTLRSLVRKLGLEDKMHPEKPPISVLGDTGAAAPILALAAEANRLAPGQRILILVYGSGCDAVLLRATEHVGSLGGKESWKRESEGGRLLVHYGRYLRFRNMLREDAALVPYSSPVVLHREEKANLRLYGEKCQRCEVVQFPPRKVCRACGSVGEFEEFKLSRQGRVFTYTVDHLAPTPDPPIVMASADLDGGGRFYGQLGDCAPDEVSVGMEVELCFRRLHTGDGFHNYFWKMRPMLR